jgi:ribosomal subunit interface protein
LKCLASPVENGAAGDAPDKEANKMPLRVSGRNINIGATLHQRITDRVEEAATKYFRGGYSGHATVGRDGFGFRTECLLHLDSGVMLEAEGMAADAYESAEQAAVRIETQLRRYKRRRKDNQARRGGKKLENARRMQEKGADSA